MHVNTNIYRRLLDSDFDSLSPQVRRAHSAPLEAFGSADVQGPTSLLGRAAARLLRLPKPGSEVPVRLTVTETEAGQVWDRRFGEQNFSSVQEIAGGFLAERYGRGTLLLRVFVCNGAVHYEPAGAKLFGITLPKFLSPRVSGVVVATDDGWQVDVEFAAPGLGRICAYQARLSWK
ncbi:MAG: DUF4166 domain-containing protein [Armatimonadetes bacterium]|nr:DUF4166 domain-containing protein [Armatimonadota bacterium]NOG93103.1 DUF4166 domain-containing protein [Armatimonadota bacterium]